MLNFRWRFNPKRMYSVQFVTRNLVRESIFFLVERSSWVNNNNKKDNWKNTQTERQLRTSIYLFCCMLLFVPLESFTERQ